MKLEKYLRAVLVSVAACQTTGVQNGEERSIPKEGAQNIDYAMSVLHGRTFADIYALPGNYKMSKWDQGKLTDLINIYNGNVVCSPKESGYPWIFANGSFSLANDPELEERMMRFVDAQGVVDHVLTTRELVDAKVRLIANISSACSIINK